MTEEYVSETNEVTEDHALENSAFLSDWQRRYREHLASLKDEGGSKEKETPKKHSVSKKKVLFEQLRKPSRSFVLKESVPSVSTVKASRTSKESEKGATQLQAVAPPIPRKEWAKASPIFIADLLLVLLAFYFIIPASKEKEITVTGNHTLSAETIIAAAQIPQADYELTTWLHSSYIARAIEASEDRVASAKVSFGFPNKITIAVTEHQVAAYIRQGDKVYPLLTNGILSNQSLSDAQDTQQSITIMMQDQELVAKLMKQLAQVDSSIVQNIQTIDLQPSKVTADLLSIKMYDENIVLVPLSEIVKKLPYYAKISPQLTVISVIDMEVGIFSYPQ